MSVPFPELSAAYPEPNGSAKGGKGEAVGHAPNSPTPMGAGLEALEGAREKLLSYMGLQIAKRTVQHAHAETTS
jgi:hypothetical protein